MEERELVWAMLGVGIAAVMLVAGLLFLVTREVPVAPPQPIPTVTSFISGFTQAEVQST
jgi:hypothetical protein